MNWNFKIDKKIVEIYSKMIGFGCLFIVLFNQSSKSYRFMPEEISFWISIVGIIFFSLHFNLKFKGKNEENLSFFQRNTPFILGIIISTVIAIFFTAISYINL